MVEGVRITRVGRENKHTASSGLVCSALGALKLCAAHKMSLLFFSVSSILHAAKSAAADASCPLCQLPVITSRRKTYDLRCRHIHHRYAPVEICGSTSRLLQRF